MTSKVRCTVENFGSDPAPGKPKVCAVAPGPSAGTAQPSRSHSRSRGNTLSEDPSVETQWGTVKKPALPDTVCGTPLRAALVPTEGRIDALDEKPGMSKPDTARIQQAIDACPAGQAVRLIAGDEGESGFLTGPLKLKSGVTLWIDDGVTLFGSRNPRDYDKGPGTCGTAVATHQNTSACAPLILVDATSGSGIVGHGAIDGRGGSLLTAGPNAGKRSWWDVAYQSKSDLLYQQNPRLIQVNDSSDFTLYGITVMNSPKFHIVTSRVKGVTAWDIKILSPSLAYTKPGYACPAGSTPDKMTPATCFTPDTIKNTDGFDPGLSQQVLLAYSYISTGDDDVAVKSSGVITDDYDGAGKSSGKPGTRQLHFAHNHFYYGHGLSVGSELNSGVSDMQVVDLTIDGHDSPNGIGLRIKSDSSRGGKVDQVGYSGICMRNVQRPLVFDSYYSAKTGTAYPSFTNVRITGMHNLGSQAYAGGALTFAGYMGHGQDNPITVTLDNVVFDSDPTLDPGKFGSSKAPDTATHFTLGPGPVSFASLIATSSHDDVTVNGTPGEMTPVDCSNAFVPLKSVLPASPI
ncbi:glycoside hydrolase family 28 protein [Xylophilus ampelinus]|uniref:glycoside hydrolase family 28 protein n=1 Tax=Xylophilus ampelinus TaxID=54067 RepID=UPI001F193472|nr:glycoside hydrolase family 28 protein [Xylophilus ampelinus]MCS4510001.1 glycoside hydrolase family 28 protein [Xylophilus ampelinus]